MESSLYLAYQLLLGVGPDGLVEWQIAEAVLANFNVPKLGEELAKKCLLRIVNHTEFPTDEKTRILVGWAESLATELWSDLPDEPHMAQLEYLERFEY